MSEQIPETTNERRNPLVLLVGFIVLGIAIGVVLFGRDWFDGSNDTAIESAPGLDTAQQTVADSRQFTRASGRRNGARLHLV